MDTIDDSKTFATATDGDTFAETWTNLKPEELIRGSTPEAIEQKCLDLCRQYIGGSWLNATKPSVDITVKRISGGLTNQLYHVRLNDTVKRVPNPIYSGGDHDDGEPVEVAIKLYQEKHIKNYKPNDYERLNDAIILTQLSEHKIGPRVYGIFNEGFIQAYHEHEQFRVKHQRDPAMLRQLAQLIARIHHLKLPLNKTDDFLLKFIRKNIEIAYEVNNISALVQELDLTLYAARPVLDEFDELLRIITKLNVPTVFCYNDFRGSNLLVTNDGATANKKRILAVDLEYGSYGARAFDLATFFNEWGKDSMLDVRFNGLPPNEEIRTFIRLYIDAIDNGEIVPGYATHQENSVEKILRETKTFFLVVQMFYLSMLLKMTDPIIPNMPFDFKKVLKDGQHIYQLYFIIKEMLIKDGTIEAEDDDGRKYYLPSENERIPLLQQQQKQA